MRRPSAAALAAALLVLALPGAAAGQAVDPGTPTTIQPDAPGATTPAPAPTATTPAPAPTTTAPAPAPTTTTPAPTTTSAVPPPATTTPPPAAAQPAPAPAPATTTTAPADDGGSANRAALVVLIVLGALVVLVLLIWAVATWQGVEPPWWPRVRHSLAELGWRASGAWSDFTDWVRLGR